MKLMNACLACVFLGLPLFAGQETRQEARQKAGQKHDTKVDSMTYETGAEWKIYSTDAAVKSLCVQKDLLWFVTEKGAGWMSLVSTKKTGGQDFTDIGGVPGTDATSCAIDGSTTGWVGTKSGLAMRMKDGFKVFRKDDGLADNTVNKILFIRGQGLWVATDNGVSLYQNGSFKSFTSKDGLAGDKVHDIAAGADGAVWFGTNKGISCYESGVWTSYTMKNGLSWNDTKALAFDPRKGALWAAVGEKDVNRFDGKEWKVFMDVADGVTALMADTQSRIWLAYSGGLMKFNGEEWVSDPQKVGITAAQVSQMFRDDKGNLWFGMEKGVLKLNNPYPY
jgi:ligand-binding sensor domain-containing protein